MSTILDPIVQFQLPNDLSTHGEFVDELFGWIFWLSVVLFLAVVGPMLWFAYKYRRRPGHKATPTGHHPILEIAWTVAPIPILAILFHLGFVGYMKLSIAPADSIEIGVTGAQWAWTFEYPTGDADSELHIPYGKPVKLIMGSNDVLHAFYVPELRAKRDLVPGMYTSMWFEAKAVKDANKTCNPDRVDDKGNVLATDCGDGTPLAGEKCDVLKGAKTGKCVGYVDLFCAEYCGGKSVGFVADIDREGQADGYKGHFSMRSKVLIQSPEDYSAYVNGLSANLTPEERGQRVWKTKACSTCHTVDGTKGTGPTWKGMWGRTENFTPTSSRSTFKIEGDEGATYIADSIKSPQKDVVADYTSASMPAIDLKDRDITDVIAYIKSLK